jgi:rod shape-determining protein MreC
MQGLARRHRNFVLLAAVLFAQLLMVAFQVKRSGDVRLIRVWAVTLITPFERLTHGAVSGIGSLWHNYVDLRNTRIENEQLKSELGETKLKLQRAEARAADADRLAVLLSFRTERGDWPLLAARVIGASAADVTRAIFINRGEKDGVGKNFAVLTPDGVVGKVVQVFPSSAQVLLLTDKDSGVGSLLATSRSLGVVKGTGGATCRMDYVLNDEELSIGETVFTSGQDRIYPKGLPVGRVTSVRSGFPFKIIELQPAARLDRLEEVFVLLQRPEGGGTEVAAPMKGLPVAGGRSVKQSPAKPLPKEPPAPSPQATPSTREGDTLAAKPRPPAR